MKIAVLGAGMIGRTIAIDLSSKHEVTSYDIDPMNLSRLEEKNIATQRANLQSYSKYAAWFQAYDICVLAVPGFMGFDALKTLITCGKDVVDISFFSEDALDLSDLAAEHNVTAIVDFGLAPGMSNMILGRVNEEMELHSFECLVGGLPKIRVKPFEYKAPFSPIDVIEEYTRPARFIANGELVTQPALTDRSLHEYGEIGTLESFVTDGLRSLIFTMPHIKNMKEKTLRYPGHAQLISSLQQAGFFSNDKVMIDGTAISAKNFTSKILFDQWRLGVDDEEFTIMQVIMHGTKAGKECEVTYSLYDEYEASTKTSSMSRTTGYTCAAVVNLLADNIFTKKGLFPPEQIGKDENCYNYIMQYLKERGVEYKRIDS